MVLYVSLKKVKTGLGRINAEQVTAPDYEVIMEQMDLIVGFDDIKTTLATAVSCQRRINFLLEGRPLVPKLDARRRNALSFCLVTPTRLLVQDVSSWVKRCSFREEAKILLLDEADK